jgi:hypothetical protein
VTLTDRIDALDWPKLTAQVGQYGCAPTSALLTPEECHDLSTLFDDVARFRSTIDMARFRFGAGQYRYFAYPLPDPVRELRTAFYRQLRPVARDWAAKLHQPAPWPGETG